tara:strand:+ start:2366 stop:2719 length:354 start_codon:yes stop_codon:yes gene_type:complete
MTSKRMDKILALVKECGMKLPMTRRSAAKLRGCGPITLDWLEAHGGIIVETEPFLGELSARARRCLSNAGITTKAKARYLLSRGIFSPNGTKCRNYGTTTHKEVVKWAFHQPEPIQT